MTRRTTRCLPGSLAREPDRHDQVHVVVGVALEHRGTQRADQLELDRVRLDRLEPVAQELRVEADLHRLTGERRRQRLAGLTDVLRDRRDRQLTLGKAKAERRIALRHQRDATNDLEQLVARKDELVVELLGQELAVVRELAVDATRREPRSVGAEDHVVLLQAELQIVGAGRDAGELLEGARRDDRLEIRECPLDRGLLHGEPVRVGRRHDDLARLEPHEDPGEHRPAFVTRRASADARDRVDQRVAIDRVQRRELDIRQTREVLARIGVQAVVGRPRCDHDNGFFRLVLDRDVAVGK